MKRCSGLGGIAILLLLAFSTSVSGETIELVTYYPTAANTGDLHVRSLTVGDELRNDTPPNGVALLFDAVGIGLPVGAVDPAGPLEVVGLNDVASPVILRSGLDTGAAGIPDIRLEVQGGVHFLGGNGDVNGDGARAPLDLLMIANYVNGAGMLDAGQYARADLNGDGQVTGLDFDLLTDVINGTRTIAQAHTQGKQIQDAALRVDRNGRVRIGEMGPNPEFNLPAPVRFNVVGRSDFRRGVAPATGESDVIVLNPSDPNVGLELISGTTGGTPYIDFRNAVGEDFDMRLQRLEDDLLLVDGGNVRFQGSAVDQPNNMIELLPQGNVGIELRAGQAGAARTPYIDFSNDATSDFDGRIILTGNDELRVAGARLDVGAGSTIPARYALHALGIRNSGARTMFHGLDGAGGSQGFHWIMAGGDTEGTHNALAFRIQQPGNVRSINVGLGWTPVGFSSAAYKKDISRLSPADTGLILSKIRRTDVVRFRYRNESSSAKIRLGVIAEEAPEEILDASGDGVSFMDFDGFLLAGVKALEERNRRLEAQLTDLEREVEQLKRQLGHRP